MMIKTKLHLLLFFFLFAFLFLSLTPASSLAKYEPTRKDPQTQKEYEKCQRTCEQQETGHPQQCVARCEEKRREQEREDERRRHGGGGGGSLYNVDPQKEYQQCQSRCQDEYKRGSQQHQLCQRRCEEKRREQEEEQHGGGGGRDDDFFNADPQKEYQQCQSSCRRKAEPRKQQRCQQRCEEKLRESEQGGGNPRITTEEEENNPYYYTQKHYHTRVRTSEGHVRVLERFGKRSELLKGIENYRFGILEANPSTFVVPTHIDADSVLFVVKGKGSISLVRQNNRETHNLEQGDVMTVPAGSIIYLINRDNNDKLVIAKLLQSISTSGRVEAFFGAGGEDPESYYSSFSDEILEAAFNTPKEKLQKLMGQQKKGAIIKASHEQIKALSPQSLWPFGGGESGGPYNLLRHRPLHSNNYGQLFQVTPRDYKQLRLIDVAVTFANISRGAMAGPYYNTRSTKIAVVVDGSGYFEMACPHVSSGSGGRHQSGGRTLQHHESGGRYQKISSKLTRGDVVVVPAGHPIATVASRDQHLQVICFDLNARDNEINSLAGKENVLKQIEKEAKELAFSVSAGEIEEILNKQEESFFFPGPHHQQQQQEKEEGRAYA